MSIGLFRWSFRWRPQWRCRGQQRRLGTGGVSRDSCDCLAMGGSYIAQPPGVVAIIVITVHMSNSFRHMVAGVANREMGCMASPRRVSSASLRGARGSLTDREKKRLAKVDSRALPSLIALLNSMVWRRRPYRHPSRTRGLAKAGNCTARPESRGSPASKGDKKLI